MKIIFANGEHLEFKHLNVLILKPKETINSVLLNIQEGARLVYTVTEQPAIQLDYDQTASGEMFIESSVQHK